MRARRYDRILAGAALALMLALPLRALAQDAGTTDAVKVQRGEADSGGPAAVATATTPAKQSQVEAPAAPATPASEVPTSSPMPIGAAPASMGNPAIATEQAAAPDPNASDPNAHDHLASLDPADRVIAERIRDLLAAKSDRIFASKKEHMAVEAFYQQRNLAPLWLDKGVENARAKSVIARLRNADADGLDLSDFRTPSFVGPNSAELGPDALAEADLKLTQLVLTYARHVQAGRFPYSRVSRNIELAQAPPEPADVLDTIAAAADAGKALDAFSPQHEPYQKLKAALAELRGKAGGARSELLEGPVITYNRINQMQDPRVPLLREMLRLTGDPADLRYDAKLADAVKKFQRANELPATGNLDARTIRELSGPTHDRQIDTIIANMERWRWHPRDLGNTHVLVNQPDFTLKVMHDGGQVWTTRIVIGKPSMPTPLLSETMKYITINPTWHVPPSIVHNEYLPALAQDPTVLARMGLRVSYHGGVHIWMPPGDGNALGRIRFNFPNRFLVYQHDTPDKYMFGHDVRAYSHGCMRVQDPAKYAEILFNIARPDEHWTAEKVKSMFGAAEQDIQLQPAQIWVHLTYQTAFVDDAGKLQFRRDVYNLDSRTLAAIKSERAVIEPASERKPEQEMAYGAGHRSARSSRHATSFRSMFSGGRPRPPRAIYYR
jgi:L,D-transpeptidase YcbB